MMIYLASPYTSPDPAVMEQRYQAVKNNCGALMLEGSTKPEPWVIYSPIVHWHTIAQEYNLPTDFDYWEKVDREVLARCDELWILMLDGWHVSRGVKAEMLIAAELGKPIKYLEPVAVKTKGVLLSGL